MPPIEVHELSSETELDALISEALDEAGVGLDELRRQADEGRFQSERARRAWFVVRGLGRC